MTDDCVNKLVKSEKIFKETNIYIYIHVHLIKHPREGELYAFGLVRCPRPPSPRPRRIFCPDHISGTIKDRHFKLGTHINWGQ